MDMQRTSTSYPGDSLLAGGTQVTGAVTILSGEGALSRGQLLGQDCRSAGAPAADAGNTGDGTVTGVTLGGKAKEGTYTLECVTAAANAGDFKIVDPDGYKLDAEATVGAAFASGHLNFTINDGAADFVVGDKFTIDVGAGSGKYRKHDSAAVDGSQYPAAILAQDVDATSADAAASAFFGGQFNSSSVTGHNAALNPALRAIGIFIKTNN